LLGEYAPGASAITNIPSRTFADIYYGGYWRWTGYARWLPYTWSVNLTNYSATISVSQPKLW
jgi:hypothetical protein